MEITKSGYVAIIGKPNVGKSSLMNALLHEKLSIITSKPQTTRKRILGILTENNYQIIFLDTPGMLKPGYLLQEKFIDQIKLTLKDADIVVIVVDIVKDSNGSGAMSDDIVKNIMKNRSVKKIVVINKIDRSNEKTVNELVLDLEGKKIFDAVIPVSVLEEYNIQLVHDAIVKLLPGGPQFYPDDQLTNEPERFFVSEIIREKIFEMYKDEIPFSTEVIIEEFKERTGAKDYISASIIVEKETQKPIIIGKNGESIKKLGRVSREAIEIFLGRNVFLELFVKVKNRWRNNPQMLKSFGYDIPDEN